MSTRGGTWAILSTSIHHLWGNEWPTNLPPFTNVLPPSSPSSDSATMNWICYCLSFSLLRSSVCCLSSARSAVGHPVGPAHCPIDLIQSEGQFSGHWTWYLFFLFFFNLFSVFYLFDFISFTGTEVVLMSPRSFGYNLNFDLLLLSLFDNKIFSLTIIGALFNISQTSSKWLLFFSNACCAIMSLKWWTVRVQCINIGRPFTTIDVQVSNNPKKSWVTPNTSHVLSSQL